MAGADHPRPVRTGSPRLTIETLRHLATALDTAVLDYRNDKSAERLAEIDLLFDQLISLIDLSGVSPAVRRETGLRTGLALLDIVARVGLPAEAEIPGADAFVDDANASWRLPLTPLRLVRLDDGPRQGEFLFSATTVRAAPRFASALSDVEMESDLAFSTWSRGWPQVTGPLIPADFVRGMSGDVRILWHGTPVWKVATVLAAMGAALAIVFGFTAAVWPGAGDSRSLRLVRRLLPPLFALVVIRLLGSFFDNQLNIFGDFANGVGIAAVVFDYLTFAWLFWVVVTGGFSWLSSTPEGIKESLNASLVKLGARIVGAIGVLVILGAGATQLGLPVMSVVAGLGVSSLAVALAVRPSLENLIGGIVLFADQPVRVGDFCSFGSYMGTVEAIGIRSTQIRGLDRTLISVPNAKFADMEIINWAQCDRMLINETVGLRYETRPDQLRYVLTKLREMAHGHPRIESDSIRIRLTGYGDSSLNIGIRIYAQTREWNDFYAIREDVFLRVCEIVAEAGTDFAVPASRLYMSRDEGLDDERSRHAVEAVDGWRQKGTLPFPFLSEAQVLALAGTVPYPPQGSVETEADAAMRRSRAERLSDAQEEHAEASAPETPTTETTTTGATTTGATTPEPADEERTEPQR
ncbi:mechanosensitive ion channel family protein [Acuticoccus mangrovi]|uniref:Mechanosensitive ion channel family protein n=1 Tax=Acuticoccus mangrovi TaxID=2796142 RepID=A0A934IPW3_9HYPH|nr:mechanosensitive ion channel family protein [Acuticoccus mangrovi]MBJ3776423.1 mechanosensitive ion channel family protein [Acuticoccus mangrovi]